MAMGRITKFVFSNFISRVSILLENLLQLCERLISCFRDERQSEEGPKHQSACMTKKEAPHSLERK